MRPLILALCLAGCVIDRPPEQNPAPPARDCPVAVATPKPVWPDSCVSDWYAKASLPSCVESYLGDLKAQQKTIAKKREAKG